jgi:hypothetical protein
MTLIAIKDKSISINSEIYYSSRFGELTLYTGRRHLVEFVTSLAYLASESVVISQLEVTTITAPFSLGMENCNRRQLAAEFHYIGQENYRHRKTSCRRQGPDSERCQSSACLHSQSTEVTTCGHRLFLSVPVRRNGVRAADVSREGEYEEDVWLNSAHGKHPRRIHRQPAVLPLTALPDGTGHRGRMFTTPAPAIFLSQGLPRFDLGASRICEAKCLGHGPVFP